jgi:hypothetical protein
MEEKAKSRLFIEDLPEDEPVTDLERKIMRFVQIRGILMHENLGPEIRKKLEAESEVLAASLSQEQIDIVAVMEEVSRMLEKWIN